MKNILIIKLWALGDILMATPLLTAIKCQWPQCRITWMIDAQNAELLTGHPLIDDLFVFDTGAWRRLLRKGNILAWARQMHAVRRHLQAHDFRAALNCHPDKWWSALFCLAPVRVCLYPTPHLPLSRLCYTHALGRRRNTRHNTDDYLRLLQPLGAPSPYDRHMTLTVTAEDHGITRQFLAVQPCYDATKPLVVLHPGTSQSSKCWPIANYAAVAAAVAPYANVVITGSAKEQILAEEISAALPPGTPPPLIAAGKLPGLRGLISLIGQAAVVITGDTSALHIASALEVPLVGLYGSTRPGDNAPLFGRHVLLFDDTVPCAPCYQARCPLKGSDYLRCQRAMTPDQVVTALNQMLSGSCFPAKLSSSTESFYESSLHS